MGLPLLRGELLQFCFVLRFFYFLSLSLYTLFFFFSRSYIHTYIHNCALQPLSQDYGLASYTTYVVCINFIHKWRDLHFKVDTEQQIFEKLSWQLFIYSQRFCQTSADRKSPKKYFRIFVLMSDLGFELVPYGLISQHTAYQTTATSY